MAIETSRLQLLPISPDHLLALVETPEQFETRSGLRAADGLRDFFVSDEVSPEWLAQLRAATVADPWVFGFAVLERASGEIMGMAAFKGPPGDDGMVEIAYGIVATYQGAVMPPRPPPHSSHSRLPASECRSSGHTRWRSPTRPHGCSRNVGSRSLVKWWTRKMGRFGGGSERRISLIRVLAQRR